MEIRKLSKEEYQNFLSSQNTARWTVFHNTWWLEIFRKWYRHRYYVEYYGVIKNNELLAVMPVPVHQKFMFLKVVAPPRLTPYLGPVFKDEILKGKLPSVISKIKEINSYFAKVLKNHYHLVINYPFSPWHVDLQPYKWAGFRVGVHYTYIINLAQSLKEIWAEMDKRKRNEIRKAESLTPEVVEDDIDSFLELNVITFRRQGVSYDLRALWGRLFEECSSRGQCKVWTAFVRGEPMASLFLVWDEKQAYYLGGGINENSKGLMSYLVWNAIKFSKEKGLNVFDFEGSDVPSIEQYFRQFGGEITPVYIIEGRRIR